MNHPASKIRLVGINHKNAPVELREQLAVPVDEQGQEMDRIAEEFSLREGVLISTCNRVEVYYVPGSDEVDPEEIGQMLAERKNVAWAEFSDAMYDYQGKQAIHHLFRVTCSLDSMVVGETQIINQVKTAYNEAKILGLTGHQFNTLFQDALALAKDVHQHTDIGENKVSVPSVAVDFVSRVFDELSQKTVLLVGAGETARICLENLIDHGVQEKIICNRSLDRARELAENMNAKTVQFELLEDYLPEADVLIVATSSETPIIGPRELRNALQHRSMNPICILDLSVPRNVHPESQELDQMYLYNIDDLERIVARNLEARSEEIDRAEEMVEEHLSKFVTSRRKDQVGPLIKELRNELMDIGDAELERSLNRLESLDEADQEEVRKMVDRILNKVLHSPITNLKEQLSGNNGQNLVNAVKILFDLDPDEEAETLDSSVEEEE